MALAQARPTASRLGDLQVGGSFTDAQSDYNVRIHGFGVYSDFDFRNHIGVEVDFRQLNDSTDPAPQKIYERDYEAGGRYFWNFGRYKPYGKAMYGRGVFNFPQQYPGAERANIAYNMFDFGGGVDIAVHPRINLRAEYEFQKWLSGPGLPKGLTPTMFTFGAAYHFPAGKPRR